MLTLLTSAVLAGAPAAPCDRYYLTVFAADDCPREIRHTHTWAVAIRTTAGPNGEVPVGIDTISWQPATLRIRPLALRPELGTNLSHQQTLAWVRSFGGRVTTFGPFEIEPTEYAAFLDRKAKLDSGRVAYRAAGALAYWQPVSNCGQSFTRPSPAVGNRLHPTPLPGAVGAERLVERYRRGGAFRDGGKVHEWLLPVVANAP